MKGVRIKSSDKAEHFLLFNSFFFFNSYYGCDYF